MQSESMVIIVIKFEDYKMPAASMGNLNPMPDIKNISYIHAGYEMTNKINLIASRKIDVKTYMSINERNALLQEESVVYYLLSCIDQMIGFDVPISEIQFFFNELNTNYLKVRIVLIYSEDIENNVKLTHHPLLTKHRQIHNEQYDEFIFLFHTRN